MSLPLHALRAFEAVARLGRLAPAARELNVTPAAVSQQLRVLRDQLGADLIRREGRLLVLTPHGQQLARSTGQALDLLRTELSRLRAPVAHDGPPRLLRLWLPPFFGQCRAAGRLIGWCEAHPEIRLEITTETWFRAIDWARCDVAVNMGHPPFDGLWSSLLHRVTLQPVCAPGLLHGPGAIYGPASLLGQRLLHEDDGSEWRRWMTQAGIAAARLPEPDISFRSFPMILEAARAGLGVALLDQTLIEAQLRSGALVPASARTISGLCDYHMICREETMADPTLNPLIASLHQTLGTEMQKA